MELKDQVCSLELAKKLKELGVWNHSLWDWHNGQLGRISNGKFWVGMTQGKTITETDVFYPAYTVAELGEMLAEVKEEWPHAGMKFPIYYIGQSGTENGWDVVSPYKTAVASDKEADARSKLLAFWVENVKLTGISLHYTVSWLI